MASINSIGEALATARRKQKLTIKDVEEAIKIRSKYISAMERDAFDQISSEAYAIGFLRTYAELLRLEPAPLVEEYRRLALIDTLDRQDAPKSSMLAGRRALVSMAGLVLLILSVTALRYIWTIVIFN